MTSVDRFVVSSGSYGCVLHPPITKNIIQDFVPYTDKNPKDVSKIFKGKKKEFTNEVNFLKKIAQIDPKSEFTTKFKGANEIKNKFLRNNNQNQTISNIYKPSVCLGKKKNSYFQIILEYGGVPVNIREEKIDYRMFLQLFRKFLKGMTNLQKQNIVHRDIKPPNVLIKKNKISLIDFGLSIDARDVYKETSMNILNYKQYIYYPPEFFIAAIMIQNKKLFEENIENMKYHLKRILYYLEQEDYFNREDYNHNNNFHTFAMKGIQEFAENIIHKEYSKLTDIFTDDIALKSDVYSIAHIIVVFHNFIDYKSNDQKQFVEEIFTNCINTNPYNRISMKDLLEKVSKEYTNTIRSKKQIHGGKLQKTFCDNMKKSYQDIPAALM